MPRHVVAYRVRGRPEGQGMGPTLVRRLTVLPRGTELPALGDWLNTQAFVELIPITFGTTPAA